MLFAQKLKYSVIIIILFYYMLDNYVVPDQFNKRKCLRNKIWCGQRCRNKGGQGDIVNFMRLKIIYLIIYIFKYIFFITCNEYAKPFQPGSVI